MRFLQRQPALRVALLYILLAALWIAISDGVVLLFVDASTPAGLTRLQTIKGLLFVLISGGGLYLLLRHAFGRQQAITDALRQSETRYRTLVERSSVAILVYDEEEILYLNPAGAALFRAESAEAAIGRSVLDFIHPDDRERLDALGRESLQRGTVRAEEIYNYRLHTGEQIYVATSSSPVTYQGRPARQAMIRDVTERKQAQLALERSNARLQALVGAIDEVVFEFDRDGYYLNVWAFHEDLLAGPPAAVIGKHFSNYLDAELSDRFEEILHQALDTGRAQTIEYPLEVPAGRRWFLGRVAPVLDADGAPETAAFLARDITERKEMETELRASHDRLQALFDSSLDAIFLANDEGRFVDVNPAGCRLLSYSHTELTQMHIWDITPTMQRAEGRAQWQTFLAQERLTGEYTLQHKDGTLCVVEFHAVANIQPGLHLSLMHDVTPRKRLEEEIRRYAEHMEALADISQLVAEARLDLQSAVDVIARRTVATLGDACVLSLVVDTGDQLEPIAFHHPDPEAQAYMDRLLEAPTGRADNPLLQDLLDRGDPVRLPEVPQNQIKRLFPPEYWPYLDHVGIHSLLIVPMRLHGAVIGTLGVTRDAPGRGYTEADQRFLLSLADRAALTITNARLFAKVRQNVTELEHRVEARTAALSETNARLAAEIDVRRAAEEEAHRQYALAEALRDSAAALTSTLRLDKVLDRILNNVGQVVPHDAASIMLIEDGKGRSVRARGYSTHEGAEEEVLRRRFDVYNIENMHYMIETGQPLAIPDTRKYEGWIQIPELAWLHSHAGAPILWEQEVIGILHLESEEPGFYTQAHAERLGAFATLAAIALRNAQRYRQAQELATLQERQRLARDLHDAVSQTLWSTTLIADVLPNLWQRDPAKGQERLERLRDLTKGALAEMRALLVELRPASLGEMGIDESLRQLVAAKASRTAMQLSFTADDFCHLDAEVQTALYRIAQEALNNVVRHAEAKTVGVRLLCDAERVQLHIDDDGTGFDPAGVPPGHLGLAIMQERAASIGATLEIKSEPGRGTHLYVSWPRGRKET